MFLALYRSLGLNTTEEAQYHSPNDTNQVIKTNNRELSIDAFFQDSSTKPRQNALTALPTGPSLALISTSVSILLTVRTYT